MIYIGWLDSVGNPSKQANPQTSFTINKPGLNKCVIISVPLVGALLIHRFFSGSNLIQIYFSGCQGHVRE